MSVEIEPGATHHRYSNVSAYRSRSHLLQRLCRGKRTLHVGCVDAGFYAQHLVENRFMHDDLMSVATRVIGVDVDEYGVARMHADGYTDIHVIDIAQAEDRSRLLDALGPAEVPEIIVCGEVIEHVANTIELVRGLIDLSRTTGAEFIITTPNPFYWGRFVNAVFRQETVHPDHNAYLSLANIEAVVRKAGGAERIEFGFYESRPPSAIRAAVKHLISLCLPCLADGIVARFRAKSDVERKG